LGAAAIQSFDIRDHGAIGDGSTLNTRPIQEAIDKAHAAGGGTVIIDDGIYISGSVRLLSNVTLHLGPTGVLKACGPSEEAYPSHALLKKNPREGKVRPCIRALVFAEDAQDICISGAGIIDGNGLAFPKDGPVRPRVICFVRCSNIHIREVTTEGGATWTQHYVHCSDVQIQNVLVRAYLPNQNNDGIDIEECHRVRIANSTIIADDDAIVLKSTLTPDHGTRDIVVENSVVYGKKSAFKIGTESFGPFENIEVRNLIAYGTRGITLYSVDGGNVRNVSINNIIIRDGYAACTLRLGHRGRYPMPGTSVSPPPGRISEITIRNLDASLSERNYREILHSGGIATTSPADATVRPVLVDFISGIPGRPIEGVRL
jgi:polygalacturonase